MASFQSEAQVYDTLIDKLSGINIVHDHYTVTSYPVEIYDTGYGDYIVIKRKTVSPRKGSTIATVNLHFDDDEILKICGEGVVCKGVDLSAEGEDDSNDGLHAIITTQGLEGTSVQHAGPVAIPYRVPLYHRKWDAKEKDHGEYGALAALFSASFWLPVLGDIASSALNIVLKGVFGPPPPSLVPRLIYTSSEIDNESYLPNTILLTPTDNTYTAMYRNSGVMNGSSLWDVWTKSAYCMSDIIDGPGQISMSQADFKRVKGTDFALFAYKMKCETDVAISGIFDFIYGARKTESKLPTGVLDWCCFKPPFNITVQADGIVTELALGKSIYLFAGKEYILTFSVDGPPDATCFADINTMKSVLNIRYKYIQPGTATNS